jgi:hypothetical protein
MKNMEKSRIVVERVNYVANEIWNDAKSEGIYYNIHIGGSVITDIHSGDFDELCEKIARITGNKINKYLESNE